MRHVCSLRPIHSHFAWPDLISRDSSFKRNNNFKQFRYKMWFLFRMNLVFNELRVEGQCFLLSCAWKSRTRQVAAQQRASCNPAAGILLNVHKTPTSPKSSKEGRGDSYSVTAP
jgi:hypothetical protein